jgi:hypothetical protein
MKRLLFWAVMLTGLYACRPQPERLPELDSVQISRVVGQMTDLMVHDISNPPLAARFYAYACLAGYEVVSRHDSTCPGMYGVLNGTHPWKSPKRVLTLTRLAPCWPCSKRPVNCSLLGNCLKNTSMPCSCRRAGFPEEVIGNSLDYAKVVSRDILAYAKTDGYNKISNFTPATRPERGGQLVPDAAGFFLTGGAVLQHGASFYPRLG